MGREYAKLDGENAAVAQAIDEHYMPRFAGDTQPQSVAGRIVSVADKIDNIVGTFSRGKIPTGSQDPFALRRQALGLVNMVIEAQYKLSLTGLVEASMKLYGITDAEAQAKMQADVADFIKLRLKNVLSDADIRYDIADAVLDNVDDIYGVYLRALAVAKAVSEKDMTSTIQAFVRVGNIATKAESDSFDAAAFTLEQEKALYEAYTEAKAAAEAASDYSVAIEAVSKLAAPIDSFFDNVMVMDKDDKVRNNRLGLMKSVDSLIGKIADFGKIVLA